MMPPFLLQLTNAKPTSLLDSIPQLEDNIAAQNFLQESFWSTSAICLLSALLLSISLAGIFLYRHYAKRPKNTGPSADELALAAIKQLQATSPTARELSLQLSLILRQYLTQETQEPTLYETHQEFSSRINSLASVPAAFQVELRNLLDELSEIKYSPELEQLTSNVTERAQKLIKGIAEDKQLRERAAATNTAQS